MAYVYNCTQLVAEIKNRVNIGSLDASIVTQFLDEAHREILGRYKFRFMRKSQTFTTVIGQQVLGTLPTDFQSAESLRITDPDNAAGKVGYKPFEQFDLLFPDTDAYPKQKPNVWTTFGPDILLGGGYPDQAYTMKLRYYRIPTPLLAGTDIPDIPVEYREVILGGALKRIHYRNDNDDKAQVIQQDIEALEMDFVGRYTERQDSEPDVMLNGRSPMGRRDGLEYL